MLIVFEMENSDCASILSRMELANNQREALDRLVDIFLAENARLNLSALRTKEQCAIGNVLDSLAFLDGARSLFGERWEEQERLVLDLGTGGGFPLLPLALMLPSWKFTGLDATLKKITAVDRMVSALGLSNVSTMCGRSEVIANDAGHRAKYDIVLARAVAPLSTLIEYCIPFTKLYGYCVFWKSMHVAEELCMALPACDALSAKLVQSYRYTLPGTWGERQLLVYQKTAPTLDVYPRKVGVPKEKPLTS